MPIADGAGGGRRGKKPPRTPILVAPTPGQTSTLGTTASAPAPAKVLGGSKVNGTGSTGKTGSSSGSASTATSAVSSAQAAYDAAQRKRDQAAVDRNVRDAEGLQGQVEALKVALGLNSRDGKLNGTFRKALRQRLDNINLVRNQQEDILTDGYGQRLDSLKADASNNLTAATDSGITNETNRGRERVSALSEAFAQGAGESDALKVQLHSLRNWDANQNDINRAYYDGARSIDGSINDLNVDTRTGLSNIFSEANADKQQMWDNFRNQTAESQTQLGNVLGQQAEYYGLAVEANANAAGGGGGGKTTLKATAKAGASGKGKSVKKGEGKTLGIKQADGPGKGRPPVPTGDLTRTWNSRPGGPNTDQAALADAAVSGFGRNPGGRPQRGQGKSTATASASITLGKGKKGRKPKNDGTLRERQDAATTASDAAFMGAAKTQGKVWDNPGLPDRILNWRGETIETPRLANTIFTMTPSSVPLAKPEGATLRKW
jgi:hypothetical protein